MMRAPSTAMACGVRLPDGDVMCPHCRGPLGIRDARHFAGIALCPHAACGRRLVVEVEGREVDGTPLEFSVSTTARYVGAVQPMARLHPGSLTLLSMAIAGLTTGCAGYVAARIMLAFHLTPLALLGLMGLTALACVSWTTIAMGWLGDRLLRAFLWRRSLVLESPSITLTTDGL